MKLTNSQFKEITNWHRGTGIIIINATADFDLRQCPGRISSLPINRGRNGKWTSNGKPLEEALNTMIEDK